jgi:hypothetical protein
LRCRPCDFSDSTISWFCHATALSHFAIMAQSFFDFVSYFWVFVHALSVTQSFFRFCQPFLRFCCALSHFLFRHLFLSFSSMLFQWLSHFLDFVTHSAIFAIMAQSFFEMSSMRFWWLGHFLISSWYVVVSQPFFDLSGIIEIWLAIYQATKRAHTYGARARGRAGLARDACGGHWGRARRRAGGTMWARHVGALIRARGLRLEWTGERGVRWGGGRLVDCLPRSDPWVVGSGDEPTGSTP